MSTNTSTDRLADVRSVELVIGGMTCASCAARIEKKLNKLDGVIATVNYTTEKAKVTYAGSLTPEDLVATIEATGYTAALPAPSQPSSGRPSARPALRVMPRTASARLRPCRMQLRVAAAHRSCSGDEPGLRSVATANGTPASRRSPTGGGLSRR